MKLMFISIYMYISFTMTMCVVVYIISNVI